MARPGNGSYVADTEAEGRQHPGQQWCFLSKRLLLTQFTSLVAAVGLTLFFLLPPFQRAILIAVCAAAWNAGLRRLLRHQKMRQQHPEATSSPMPDHVPMDAGQQHSAAGGTCSLLSSFQCGRALEPEILSARYQGADAITMPSLTDQAAAASSFSPSLCHSAASGDATKLLLSCTVPYAPLKDAHAMRERLGPQPATHGSADLNLLGNLPAAISLIPQINCLPVSDSKANALGCSDLNSGGSDQGPKPTSALLQRLRLPDGEDTASCNGGVSNCGNGSGGTAAATTAAGSSQALRSDAAEASDMSETEAMLSSSIHWGGSLDWVTTCSPALEMALAPAGVADAYHDLSPSDNSRGLSDSGSDDDGGNGMSSGSGSGRSALWHGNSGCSALPSGPADNSLWLGNALDATLRHDDMPLRAPALRRCTAQNQTLSRNERSLPQPAQTVRDFGDLRDFRGDRGPRRMNEMLCILQELSASPQVDRGDGRGGVDPGRVSEDNVGTGGGGHRCYGDYGGRVGVGGRTSDAGDGSGDVSRTGLRGTYRGSIGGGRWPSGQPVDGQAAGGVGMDSSRCSLGGAAQAAVLLPGPLRGPLYSGSGAGPPTPGSAVVGAPAPAPESTAGLTGPGDAVAFGSGGSGGGSGGSATATAAGAATARLSKGSGGSSMQQSCLYTSPRQHAFVSLKLRNGPLSSPIRRMSVASLRRSLTGASAPPSPCGQGAPTGEANAMSYGFPAGGAQLTSSSDGASAMAPFPPQDRGHMRGGGGGAEAAAGNAVAPGAAEGGTRNSPAAAAVGGAVGRRPGFEQLAAAAVEATQTVLAQSREALWPQTCPHMASWLALPGCIHLIVYLWWHLPGRVLAAGRERPRGAAAAAVTVESAAATQSTPSPPAAAWPRGSAAMNAPQPQPVSAEWRRAAGSAGSRGPVGRGGGGWTLRGNRAATEAHGDEDTGHAWAAHNILASLQAALEPSEFAAAAWPPLQDQDALRARPQSPLQQVQTPPNVAHENSVPGETAAAPSRRVLSSLPCVAAAPAAETAFGGAVGIIEDWPLPADEGELDQGDDVDDDSGGDDGGRYYNAGTDQHAAAAIAAGNFVWRSPGRPAAGRATDPARAQGGFNPSPSPSPSPSASPSPRASPTSGGRTAVRRMVPELWPLLHVPVTRAVALEAADELSPSASAAHARQHAMELSSASSEWGSTSSTEIWEVEAPPLPPQLPPPPPAPHRPPTTLPSPVTPSRHRWHYVGSERAISETTAPTGRESPHSDAAASGAVRRAEGPGGAFEALSIIAAARVGSTLLMLDPAAAPRHGPIPVPYTMLLHPPCAELLREEGAGGDAASGSSSGGNGTGGGDETGCAVATVVLLPAGDSVDGSCSRRRAPLPPPCRILVVQGDRVLYDERHLAAEVGVEGGGDAEPAAATSFRYQVEVRGARPGVAAVHVLGLPQTPPKTTGTAPGPSSASAQRPDQPHSGHCLFLTVSAMAIMPRAAADELTSLYSRMVDEQLELARPSAGNIINNAVAAAAAAATARLEAERRVVDEHWIPFVQDLEFCFNRRPLPPAPAARLLPPRQRSGPAALGAPACTRAPSSAAFAVPSFASEAAVPLAEEAHHRPHVLTAPPTGVAAGPMVLGSDPWVPFTVWNDVLMVVAGFLRQHDLLHVLSHVMLAQTTTLGVVDGPAVALQRRLQLLQQQPAAQAGTWQLTSGRSSEVVGADVAAAAPWPLREGDLVSELRASLDQLAVAAAAVTSGSAVGGTTMAAPPVQRHLAPVTQMSPPPPPPPPSSSPRLPTSQQQQQQPLPPLPEELSMTSAGPEQAFHSGGENLYHAVFVPYRTAETEGAQDLDVASSSVAVPSSGPWLFHRNSSFWGPDSSTAQAATTNTNTNPNSNTQMSGGTCTAQGAQGGDAGCGSDKYSFIWRGVSSRARGGLRGSFELSPPPTASSPFMTHSWLLPHTTALGEDQSPFVAPGGPLPTVEEAALPPPPLPPPPLPPPPLPPPLSAPPLPLGQPSAFISSTHRLARLPEAYSNGSGTSARSVTSGGSHSSSSKGKGPAGSIGGASSSGGYGSAHSSVHSAPVSYKSMVKQMSPPFPSREVAAGPVTTAAAAAAALGSMSSWPGALPLRLDHLTDRLPDRGGGGGSGVPLQPKHTPAGRDVPRPNEASSGGDTAAAAVAVIPSTGPGAGAGTRGTTAKATIPSAGVRVGRGHDRHRAAAAMKMAPALPVHASEPPSPLAGQRARQGGGQEGGGQEGGGQEGGGPGDEGSSKPVKPVSITLEEAAARVHVMLDLWLGMPAQLVMMFVHVMQINKRTDILDAASNTSGSGGGGGGGDDEALQALQNAVFYLILLSYLLRAWPYLFLRILSPLSYGRMKLWAGLLAHVAHVATVAVTLWWRSAAPLSPSVAQLLAVTAEYDKLHVSLVLPLLLNQLDWKWYLELLLLGLPFSWWLQRDQAATEDVSAIVSTNSGIGLRSSSGGGGGGGPQGHSQLWSVAVPTAVSIFVYCLYRYSVRGDTQKAVAKKAV